mmetsp:Transcript_50805/g.143929  ORF Transcript_50805/g.143929 Transcript_50805/m.143929 type:complete len:310 (+) Transcript_50805:84-1013(+)
MYVRGVRYPRNAAAGGGGGGGGLFNPGTGGCPEAPGYGPAPLWPLHVGPMPLGAPPGLGFPTPSLYGRPGLPEVRQMQLFRSSLSEAFSRDTSSSSTRSVALHKEDIHPLLQSPSTGSTVSGPPRLELSPCTSTQWSEEPDQADDDQRLADFDGAEGASMLKTLSPSSSTSSLASEESSASRDECLVRVGLMKHPRCMSMRAVRSILPPPFGCGLPSLGTANHGHSCKPCKYVARSRGCVGERICMLCHSDEHLGMSYGQLNRMWKRKAKATYTRHSQDDEPDDLSPLEPYVREGEAVKTGNFVVVFSF